MKNIPGLVDGDDNQGSLRQILFVPINSVFFRHLYNADGLIDLQQYLDAGVIFNSIGFTLDSASFKEDEEHTANGPYYKQTIECAIPKDYSFRRNQFEEMENYEYLVIGLGYTERSFLIGELDEEYVRSGMRVKKKFTTDDKFKDKSTYTLTFYKESRNAAKACFNFPVVEVSTEFPTDNHIYSEIDIDPPLG